MKNKLIMIVSVAGMCLLAGCGNDAKVEEAAVNQAEEQTPIKEEETPQKDEEQTLNKEEETKDDEIKLDETSAKEETNIADGDYVTDETYKGDLTSDGATLTIETALSHYDEDWNTIKDYDKNTYVFRAANGCKCIIYQEEAEEYPISEQVDFINEFLHGNSGLPITLKIRNNELVEIGFSS